MVATKIAPHERVVPQKWKTRFCRSRQPVFKIAGAAKRTHFQQVQDLRECYRILDVAPEASLEDVKRAYRELVKVWHPDRFVHDPKLQIKAQEKLKVINSAFERICSRGPTFGARGTSGSPDPQTTRQNETPPQPPRPTTPSRPEANPKHSFGQIAVAVVLIAFAGMIFLARDRSRQSRVANQHAGPQPTTFQTQQPPTAAQSANAFLGADVAQRETGGKAPAAPSLTDSRRAELTARGIFTIGSTKDEVLAVQGTPNEFTDSVFTYSYGSKVFFRENRVTSWKMGPVNPLKARLLPATDIGTPEFITVGSTKDQVLAVQGTPDEFTDTVFTYSYGSKVFFQDNRVTSWKMRPVNPLKVRLLLTPVAVAPEFFTVGSTKDEVLAVQGTPDEFTDTVFTYPYGSKVIFHDNRVSSWKTSPVNPLKVKLGK